MSDRGTDEGRTRREILERAVAGAGLLALGGAPAALAARRRSRSVDVVVVGAGLSRLSAARALAAAGQEVLVLEARRVGGRTLNHSIGGGHVVEAGGEFVGPTQDRILALSRAVGVTTFPVYNQGSNVEIIGGQRSLYPASSGIPTDPETQQFLIDLLAKIDAIAKEVGPTTPWRAKRARQLDATTLAEFTRPFVSDRTRPVFEAVNNSVWGVDSDQLSLLYFASYVAAAGDQHNPGSLFRLISPRAARRSAGSSAGRSSSPSEWRSSSDVGCCSARPSQDWP